MKRSLVVAGLPFSVTIFVLSYFSPIVVVLLATVGVVLNYLMYKNKTILVIIIISIVFAFIITGNYQKNVLFDTAEFDGVSGSVTAKVLDMQPSSSGLTTAYTIEIIDSEIGLPIGFNGILYANFEVEVDYYNVIQVDMVCNHITSSKGFDYSAYYQSIGILMQFYSYSTPTILEYNNYTLAYYLKSFNENLCSIFDENFTSEYSGMMKAMLLGNNNDLDDGLYSNAARCGVNHIFVVSGLHIALLVGIFDKLFDLARFSHKYKGFRKILLIILTWFLVLLTGCKLSTIRAGIMVTLFLLSHFFCRKNDGLNSLFGAVILILVPSPYVIHSLSFQLSFGATLGIILFAERLKLFILDCLKSGVKVAPIVDYVVTSVTVTLSATIGMFPSSLIAFKGISVISLLANLLIVPFLPLVLTLSIVMLIVSFSPLLVSVIRTITMMLLFIVKGLVNFLGELKFAYLGLDFSIVWLYFVSVTIIVVFIIVLGVRSKGFIAKFLAMFTLATSISTYIINYNTLTITTFSDHTTNAVVLTNRDTATVVSFDNGAASNYSINTYLQGKNVYNVKNYVNLSDSDISNSRIFIENGSYLYCHAGDSNYAVGEISNLKILVTDSIEVANNVEYDILFLATESKQYLNKKVFLLNEIVTVNFKL